MSESMQEQIKRLQDEGKMYKPKETIRGVNKPMEKEPLVILDDPQGGEPALRDQDGNPIDGKTEVPTISEIVKERGQGEKIVIPEGVLTDKDKKEWTETKNRPGVIFQDKTPIPEVLGPKELEDWEGVDPKVKAAHDRIKQLQKEAYIETVVEHVWEKYPDVRFLTIKDKMALYMYFQLVDWDKKVVNMILEAGNMQQEIVDKIGFVRLSIEVVKVRGKIIFPPNSLKREEEDEVVAD